MRRLPQILWLTFVWLFLWESPSVANVLSGIAVAVGLLIVYPSGASVLPRIRPLPLLRFAAYFLWKLVEASAILAWEVVTPRNRINEGIVAVPIRGTSPTLTTVVANSISLTPGTLTLDVDQDPTVLYVHVLHLREIEDVRADILHLEELIIRAFGDEEERRALTGARPTTQEDTP